MVGAGTGTLHHDQGGGDHNPLAQPVDSSGNPDQHHYVSTNRITAILTSMCGVSVETALRLARYFGTTPQFWMNLQSNYDLRLAEAKVGNRIRAEIATRPMAAA